MLYAGKVNYKGMFVGITASSRRARIRSILAAYAGGTRAAPLRVEKLGDPCAEADDHSQNVTCYLPNDNPFLHPSSSTRFLTGDFATCASRAGAIGENPPTSAVVGCQPCLASHRFVRLPCFPLLVLVAEVDLDDRRRSSGSLYFAPGLDHATPELAGELPLEALNMAFWQRQPEAVIHHSDQGCQYTSIAFGLRCRKAGVRPSMGFTGDCYDNALCESFFATLECERLGRRNYRTQAEARMSVFQYIEGWYNLHRRHSALGYLSPMNFEKTSSDVALAAD